MIYTIDTERIKEVVTLKKIRGKLKDTASDAKEGIKKLASKVRLPKVKIT